MAETLSLTSAESAPEPQESGWTFHDFATAVFKHKWLIIATGTLGLIAAALTFQFYPKMYESQSKLLVRYVLERSAVDSVETTGGEAAKYNSASIIGSELEILTSWDLAMQVAEAIGPQRLLPEAGPSVSKEQAAGTVSGGLRVMPGGGSTIFVTYKNRDPNLAGLVLNELVNLYFTKHLEVHRSTGAFSFVSQQTDQVRARLHQTEEALRELKSKVGITSLVASTDALQSDVRKIEEGLEDLEGDLAAQRARIEQLGVAPPETGSSPRAGRTSRPETGMAERKEGEPSNREIRQYRMLVARLAKLNEAQLELINKYTPESQILQSNQTEIEAAEREKNQMEEKYPDIPATILPGGPGEDTSFAAERAKLAALEAKKTFLQERLRRTQVRLSQLSELSPQIIDLERRRELEEANYKYFQNSLEKARIDEALDPSKMPNISAVQRPSPPILVTGKRDKICLALILGGLGLGAGIAILRGVILNRTFRRPADVEARLQTSLLLSIPSALNGYRARPRLALPGPGGAANSNSHIAPWEGTHFIRPYAEALRDRISLYFERTGLAHKPKLLGVAGISNGSGSSTIAAGLAAAFSEMGDGKVLLVDVNLTHAEAHPFFRGRPAAPLSAALEPESTIPSAADNLYLATAMSQNNGPIERALKRFFTLMPNLRASDFDYIIFDMPALTDTSPAWRMASFMDKMLVVVEADKTDRENAKRAYAELIQARPNVSVILNKVSSHAPAWLAG